MSKPSENVASRAAVKGFTLNLGLVNVIGDLHGIHVPNATKEESFKLVCPTCNEPHRVEQQYVCPEDPEHGPFASGDCGKAKDLGGEQYVKVSKEQIDAAKQSELPRHHLELTIHRLADVDPFLVPGGNTYYFAPAGPTTSYGLLIEEVRSHPELVFMGTVNIRNQDHTARLAIALDGNLVVQEVEWFQDVKQLEAPAYDEPTAKNRAMGDALVEGLVEDFDPAAYTKQARDRLATLVAQAAAGELPEVPTTTASASRQADDLESRLEAMLAGMKKAKKPLRKAS